jgi:cytochrome c peroxidase
LDRVPASSPRLVLVSAVLALTISACMDGAPSVTGDHPGGHPHAGDGSHPGDAPIPPDFSAERDAGNADAGTADGGNTEYHWDLPSWFPPPLVPDDNPMSDVKVELGRHLFYDQQLSANGTQSCASCHRQELAFTDGKTGAVGSTGEVHPRNSMGLANVAYVGSVTWANPLLLVLEQQAVVPIFGNEPVELGMSGKEDELVARLRANERYRALFPRAFPEHDDPFSIATLVRALSAFERTLISGDSPFDRHTYGRDPNAISAAAKSGAELFNSERLECFHCHNGFAMQDSINYDGKGPLELRYHNTGLYNINNRGDYPAPNTGVHELTRKPQDMGRFRTQSLRNVALTAPYMHDGSIATLDEVIDHYAAGGRRIATGPNAGDGAQSPLKSDFIQGFKITAEERADLIDFLESLTDEGFITNPAFADPWQGPCALCEPSE